VGPLDRAAFAAALAAALVACGGGAGEETRWEEETLYEEHAGRYDDRRDERHREERYREERPLPRYGGREAIDSPKEGVFCDALVESCYTGEEAHVGWTERRFGDEAGRRLDRRLDEGEESMRAVFRSQGGVCDRLSGVCYDRRGPSLALTQRHLGRGAAADLEARLEASERGGRGYARGGAITSPRRGVSCDAAVETCYAEEEAHVGWTERQFGEDAAQRLRRRLDRGDDARDGLYRPDEGAVCDRLAEVCYERAIASARLTRLEFGRGAAERLVDRLE
jgi:uncharacterized protein (DUF779 family)